MRILVTGFEPFGNDTINPSTLVIKELSHEMKGALIDTLLLPVIGDQALVFIEKQLKQVNYDVVVCLGQAAGRAGLSVERVAINIDDYRIPDQAGNQPIDEVIFLDGEAAYFSDLPIKAMVKQCREKGVCANVSNSAGTYVCNHVMYGCAYLKKHFNQNYRSGFIHLPCLPQQSDTLPVMSLSDMKIGIEAMLEAIITYETDEKISEGSIC